MKTEKMSCADCGAAKCHMGDTNFTEFCPTGKMDPDFLNEIKQEYLDDEENLKLMQVSSDVEYEGYGNWPRVVEIAQFALRMGYKKIGLAACVGLLKEARVAAKVLRSYGLEVYGIGCKVGMIPKQDMGIPEEHNATGMSICNPIMQATLLAEHGTEFNVVIGLCVGHDTLFIKHSDAPVTYLIVKDRVLAHNPAAALYQSSMYYRRIMEPGFPPERPR